MKQINTSLTVVNHLDVRGRAIVDLIQKYLPIPVHYGFRSLGAHPEFSFPCVFVEPKREIPVMYTTAKWRTKFEFGIYWYVRDSKPEDAVTQASFIGSALKKLFSNNALNDLQSANPPTNQYAVYGGHWYLSDITDVRYSVNYLDPKVSGVRQERAGRMMFQVEDEYLM